MIGRCSFKRLVCSRDTKVVTPTGYSSHCIEPNSGVSAPTATAMILHAALGLPKAENAAILIFCVEVVRMLIFALH